MNLQQFYHVARAACAIAGQEFVMVFGSNALLPWLKDLGIEDMKQFLDPQQVSRELDLCLGDGTDDSLNIMVDAAIGELSFFDVNHHVYAHPNPIEGLFLAPKSWSTRMRIEKDPQSDFKILVPHYADLVVSKIIAGRPKDMDFAQKATLLFGIQVETIAALIQEYLEEAPQDKPRATSNFKLWRHRLEAESSGPSR